MPAQMTFVSIDFGRPPLAQFYFDVWLHNPRDDSRWFLLPDEGPLARSEPYAVDTVNVYQLSDEVTIGHFSGRHGCFALQLPPGGRVVLKFFPITVLDEFDEPPHFTVEVVTASELRVGGEPPQTWFGMDTLNKGEAIVSAETMTNQLEVVFSRSTPDRSEVPITFDEDERIRLEIETV